MTLEHTMLRAILRALDQDRLDDAMLLLSEYHSTVTNEEHERASGIKISHYDLTQLIRAAIAQRTRS